MSRAQNKRLATEDEVTEVPLVKEIMLRDEDMEPVRIRRFTVEPCKIKRIFFKDQKAVPKLKW